MFLKSNNCLPTETPPKVLVVERNDLFEVGLWIGAIRGVEVALSKAAEGHGLDKEECDDVGVLLGRIRAKLNKVHDRSMRKSLALNLGDGKSQV